MISCETKSGIKVEVVEEALDSMELLDALCDLDEDKGSAMVHVSDLLFTRKGKKKIYKQLEAALGHRVRVADFYAFLGEILEALRDLKK